MLPKEGKARAAPIHAVVVQDRFYFVFDEIYVLASTWWVQIGRPRCFAGWCEHVPPPSALPVPSADIFGRFFKSALRI